MSGSAAAGLGRASGVVASVASAGSSRLLPIAFRHLLPAQPHVDGPFSTQPGGESVRPIFGQLCGWLPGPTPFAHRVSRLFRNKGPPSGDGEPQLSRRLLWRRRDGMTFPSRLGGDARLIHYQVRAPPRLPGAPRSDRDREGQRPRLLDAIDLLESNRLADGGCPSSSALPSTAQSSVIAEVEPVLQRAWRCARLRTMMSAHVRGRGSSRGCEHALAR